MYLISADHPGFRTMFVPMAVYRPDDPQTPIDIGEGYGPHCLGASFSFSQALERRRWLEEANATWFIPFLERLAKGEHVPIAEIRKAYRDIFGKEIPCAMSHDL